LTVIVVDVNLNGSTACQIAYNRVKTINIDGAGYPDVSFVGNNLLFISLKEETATGCDLYLEPITSGTPAYHCRLGGETGPIIVNQDVDEFTLTSQATTIIEFMEIFEDGCVLVETNLEMFPKIPGLQVDLHIFVSGVTFEDSTLDKTIMTDDFSTASPSLHPYQMIANPGISTGTCHTIKIYQNNVQIGN